MTKHLRRLGVSIADSGRRLASLRGPALRIAQLSLLVVAVCLVAVLALLALDSGWERKGPHWLQRLNDGGDWRPTVLVTAVIALLCILTYRVRRDRSSSATPVMIVVGLTATSLVMGFSSYWSCSNPRHPKFVTALLWTVSLVKGGIGDMSLDSQNNKPGLCPHTTPTALEVAPALARLSTARWARPTLPGNSSSASVARSYARKNSL